MKGYLSLIFCIGAFLVFNSQIFAQCALQAATCNTCDGCNVAVDFTDGTTVNQAAEFGVDFGMGFTPITSGNYDPATNMGTLTIPAGTTNVFSTGGIENLSLPSDIISLCYTADINVVSGSNFGIEIRIENGGGSPGSGGGALQIGQGVSGPPGMCSIGGNWTIDPNDTDDFTNFNGFSFTPIPGSNAFVLVISIVDFSNMPVANDIEVEISNIEFTYCTPANGASSPTSVTTQPMPTTVCAGEDADFTIVMRSMTVTYQWQSDCSGAFTDIAGATSATYTVSSAQAADACNYQVVVTNAAGCITISDEVSLTVNDNPTPIEATTTDFTICQGDIITDFEADQPTGGSLYSPCTINWFDVPTAGNMVGTGTTFNSNGITGEEGTTVDTNTPGTYTFYAEADCNGCPSDSRTPFTLTIESAAPQCMAQDITITLDGTGNATITADDIDNGSMLGCAYGILDFSLDQTTFTCDNVTTTNTVTLTVDDGNGNSSTCTATVTVLPDAACTDPSFDCPPMQTSCTGEPFNLNPTDPGGTYGGTAAPFVMNDILNPTGMPPGSYTLTYTVNGFTSELCEFTVVAPPKSANAGSLNN